MAPPCERSSRDEEARAGVLAIPVAHSPIAIGMDCIVYIFNSQQVVAATMLSPLSLAALCVLAAIFGRRYCARSPPRPQRRSRCRGAAGDRADFFAAGLRQVQGQPRL